MMHIGSLVAVWFALAVQDSPPPVVERPNDDLRDVKQLFVPFDQVDKFRDPISAYQTMRYDAFLELLGAAETVAKANRWTGPVAGSISGRVDVDGRRVVGTSAWSFSKNRTDVVELRPWNLRVLAVRERGRSAKPDWGLTPDGALIVRGLSTEGRTVDIDWETPGESPDRKWMIRGQTPRCASLQIKLDYPTDWEAWAPASFASAAPTEGVKRLESRSSGESTWTMELTPPNAFDGERPLSTWRRESSFRFGPTRTDVELRAVVQIDRERNPEVRVRLPAGFDGLLLSTVGAAAQWERRALREGGAEWTARFARPPIGTVQLVATGSAPTPRGRPWPMESLAVANAEFRGERLDAAVDPALRLVRLDPARLSRRDFRAEGAVAKWQFVGFSEENRPTIHLEHLGGEVEARFQHFLDVGRDRVRLASRCDWSCIRGESAQPTLLVPAGWKVVRTAVDPPSRMRGEPTVEQESDGRLRATFPLSRPLQTGEKVQIVVHCERPSSSWLPSAGVDVPLPETSAPDANHIGRLHYSVRVDSSLPLRLVGDDPQWASVAAASGAPPNEWNWDADVARFRYTAPLRTALRGQESRRLAFDADVLTSILDRSGVWDLRTAIAVAVRSGESGWLEIESSRPLPSDARWTWNGSEGAESDVQPALEQPKTGRARYRAPLRVGADGRSTLQVAWKSSEPSIEPIRFHLPEAERTTHRAVVLTSDANRIEVSAEGWRESSEAPPDGEAAVRWSGRLERAEGDALLRVRRVAPANESTERGGEIHGFVHVQGPPGRRTFHCSLDVAVDAAAPLSLKAPSVARLRSAAIDGQSVSAWVQRSEKDAVIAIGESIPRGRHRVDLQFDAPVDFAREIATLGAAAPWRVGRLVWLLDADDVAWSGRGDARLLGALRWRPMNSPEFSLERQAESAGRGKSDRENFALRRTARLLRASPEILGLDRAYDVAEALLLLQQRLPDGWLLLVDASRRIAAFSGGRSPPTAEDWLAAVGYRVSLGNGVVLLTGRPLNGALDANGGLLSPAEFAEAKANAIRTNGVDPWGLFVPASEWRAAAGDEDRILNGLPAAAATLVYVGDGAPLMNPPPRASTARTATWLGFLIGAVGAGVVAFCGRRIWIGLPVAALTAYIVGLLAAHPLDSFLKAAAWGSILGAAIAMTAAHVRRARSGSALLLAFIPLCPADAADEKTALIPFDASRLNAPLTSVEVPESLLRQLRSLAEQKSGRFLISSADYQGVVEGDRIAWKAAFQLSTFAQEPPLRAAIGFVGVDVQSVEVDGKPIGFLSPTSSLPLIATLPTTPRQRMTIAFRTPISTSDLGSTIEFPLPAAAQQSFRITGFSKPVDLVRTNESRGFKTIDDGGRSTVSGVRGPSTLLQLIWRARHAPSPPPPNVGCVVSLRPESRSGAWEMQSHFVWEPSDGAREIVFPIADGAIVRRIDAPGLVGYRKTTNEAGVEQLQVSIAAGARPGALTIHSWHLPQDARGFSPPLFFPDGAAVQGVVGLTIPEELALDVAAGRDVKEISADDFRAEWEDATAYQPPESIDKAFSFTDRNHALALRSRPAAEPGRVAQEHSIRFAPHGRAADWEGTFHFAAGEPIESAGFRIPNGFECERVESDSLFQWFRRADELTLRFNKPMNGTWQVRAFGRFEGRQADLEPPVSLAPFRPTGMAAGAISWTIAGERGINVELARPAPSNMQVRRLDGKLVIEGPNADAVLALKLTRAPPRISARQVVVVRRRSGGWECQGRLDLRSEGAALESLEASTPVELGSVEWAAAGIRVVDRGTKDGFRRWLVEPRTSDAATAGALSLSWRSQTSVAEAPEAVLHDPIARLPAGVAHEIWIAQSTGGGVDAEPVGYQKETIPLWMQAMTTGLGADQRMSVWRGDAAGRIAFKASPEASADERAHSQGWMDLAVGMSGRCKGRAAWWVFNPKERMAIRLPPGCEVLNLRVDGRSAATVPAGDDHLPIAFGGRAKCTHVELEWSAPNATPPELRQANPGPTLVRVRSPFGYEAAAESAPREAWFTRLLERECAAWSERSPEGRADAVDSIGIRSLSQTAKEASGGMDAEAERVWSAFLDAVRAAHGEEVAYRLANADDAGDEAAFPRLGVADAGLVVDHFDFPGAPQLPPTLDSPRLQPTPRRTSHLGLFTIVVALLGGASWALQRRPTTATARQ